MKEGLTIEHDLATSGRVITVSGPQDCGKTTWISKEIDAWEAIGITCAHVDAGYGVDDGREISELLADRSITFIYVERQS